MTLIECFTGSHIDNIAASLRLQPEKMVLVGPAEEMTAPAERYRRFFQNRGQNTEVALWDVSGMDLRDLCGSLDTLVQREEGCVIDLTGGDELVIMAIGAVLAHMEEPLRKKIRVTYTEQMNRFNPGRPHEL